MSLQTKGTIKANFVTGAKPTQQQFYDLIESQIGCIGKLIGANMNTTADQIINLTGGTKFIITDIVFTNASVNLNTANIGDFYTGVGRSGNLIAQFLTGSFAFLTTALKFINYITLGFSIGFDIAPSTLYFSITTPQGAPATCDIYIFGFPTA